MLESPPMARVHDLGGQPGAPIDRSEHPPSWWEKRIDVLLQLLWSPERKLITVDEMRRAIESMEPERYQASTYYERWLFALETLLVEKGILTQAQIEDK